MFLELLPLAIGSAIYPTLLTMVLILIGRPNPRRLLIAFALGAFATSISAGCIVVFALNGTVGGSDHTVGPAIDFAMAAALLVLLWVLLTDRDRGIRERRQRKQDEKAGQDDDGRDPWTRRVLARDSVWIAFVVGLVLNVPGALYLVALKDIAAADLSTARSVLNIVLFNVIMFLMLEVPLVGYIVAPERTEQGINSFNAWLSAHTRQIATWLCAAAAAFLIVNGFAAL
jgi:hypothetical protein